MFQITTAVKKIIALKKRLKVIQGGSSAGKTIAILLILIELAQLKKGTMIISVVSETIPHLKRGGIRDFLSIMQEHDYYKDANWNRTDYIYTFETGNKIEFFSADTPDKVRGPRRNILFINECNNISYETYTQLAIRTSGDIYLDYNPVAEFWVHEEIIPNKDHDFIILTYKDNEALAPAIVEEIESRKGNRNFWQIYGLGLLGEMEGKIYKNWKIIGEIPHEARLERRGLDYGYSNDESAIIDIYYFNGGYILNEICFRKGLSNRQLADIILAQDSDVLVIADSAEPKSIAEMASYGINIVGAPKGKDSVRQGIQFVQDQKISVTKWSVNLIKDYRNYLWKTDKNGKVLKEPEHHFSNSMDASRYGFSLMQSSIAREQEKVYNNTVDEYIDSLKGGETQKTWTDTHYDKYFD